jgi:hypothetical protein
LLLHTALRQVLAIAQPVVTKLETQVKAWTKPTTDSLIEGMAADLVKSKERLTMENAFLRQQVRDVLRGIIRDYYREAA